MCARISLCIQSIGAWLAALFIWSQQQPLSAMCGSASISEAEQDIASSMT